MADATQYTFTHKEVVTALIKAQNLHDGVWQLVVGMGFVAANFGESEETIIPGAMVHIANVGIARVEKANNIAVDASVVNPR